MNDTFELREYHYGTAEYKKGLLLRYKILDTECGVNDWALRFIYAPDPTEEKNITLGVFQEDALVGTVSLIPLGEGKLRLKQFAIETRLQGQGLGTRLMAYAHDIARERGYSHISLLARPNAIPLYRKFGYAETGKVTHHPLFDLCEMAVEL